MSARRVTNLSQVKKVVVDLYYTGDQRNTVYGVGKLYSLRKLQEIKEIPLSSVTISTEDYALYCIKKSFRQFKMFTKLHQPTEFNEIEVMVNKVELNPESETQLPKIVAETRNTIKNFYN